MEEGAIFEKNPALKNIGSVAFSTPMKFICSSEAETRKERMKSAARYPSKSFFNLTDSKAHLV